MSDFGDSAGSFASIPGLQGPLTGLILA
jgi:hypothetical protein